MTENVTGQTRQHCLSFVREIEIWSPASEELVVVNNVLPFVANPRRVNIAYAPYHFIYHAELIGCIVSNIHFTDNIHSLTLEWINLTAKCATDIARSLHQAPNLLALNLSQNPLCSGVSDLADNLYHVPQLTELKLRDVHMGDKETEVLATSLKYLKKLQGLHLSFNPLGHGIIALAKHLSSVPHLTQLWLNDTQMGEEEVSALVRALKSVPGLEWLCLASNPLGRGVSDVIQHLSSIPKLVSLDLSGVKMTKKEAEELCAAVRGTNFNLDTDYHVSVLFLLTFVCTLCVLYLLIVVTVPNNLLKNHFCE